jgi:hypothetical protein
MPFKYNQYGEFGLFLNNLAHNLIYGPEGDFPRITVGEEFKHQLK